MQNTVQGPVSIIADRRVKADSTVELDELRGILVHRRRLILGTAALLSIATLIYCLLTPSLYNATAQIIIDPRDRQVVSNDVNPSSISPDGGITQVESQVSVAQSTGVLTRAIAATDLTKDSEFNSQGMIARLLAHFEGATTVPGPDDDTARTLDKLRKNLAVKRADKVLVIDVTVTALTAEKAARIANAIAAAYLEDQSDARAQAARQASEGLTARLAEQRKQVEDAENAVERYKNENNLIMASGRFVSEQALTDINTELANARSLSSTLKAQVDQIRRQRQGGLTSDSTSEVLRSSVISKLREQEATLSEKISDMESQYGPRHPALVSIRAQEQSLYRLIDKELDRIAAAADIDYERALVNEKALAARQAALEQDTLVNDQASVRLRELQRDLDAVREIYATFLKRSQETREQSGIDSTNARIISQALPPLKRNWPPTPLLLAGALFGGLGLGAGIALLAEYASPTVLSEGQIRNATGAPVIGLLPTEVRRNRFGTSFHRKLLGADKYREELLLPANITGTLGLALRRLADLGDWRRDRNVVPSVFVASRLEDEAERMRICALLTATAAGRGERVLFVDANISRSTGTAEAGLMDVLSGASGLERAVTHLQRKNITFLGVGRQRPILNEAEGLAHARKMLQDARGMFDLIIIDGGALTENIKAAALLAAASSLVLVAELKSTPMNSLVAEAMAASIMGRSISAALLVDGKI